MTGWYHGGYSLNACVPPHFIDLAGHESIHLYSQHLEAE